MMPSPLPRVYLVTDPAAGQLPSRVAAALRGLPPGAVGVQLRAKDMEGRDLLELARALRQATAEAGQVLLVNDRLDVAALAGADGIHLPSLGIPPEEARRVLGTRAIVGVSCHSFDEVRRARDGGADYAHFGPVFETPSKRAYGPPVGIDRLRQAASLGLPLVGLGGVEPGNAQAVVSAGAFGVGAIRAWTAASDPAATVLALLAAVLGASPRAPERR
ncbi:MAG TPA: thiamine phosphate synthase [Anaeromyxobacteraceae bacterium]|nr:thiamine phosphate synthase [Anaeromyxobacteraceae bacterium]